MGPLLRHCLRGGNGQKAAGPWCGGPAGVPGAQLLGDAADRRASITELTGRSNADIVTDLSADSGYTGLGELDAQRAEHVGAAYRHDCLSAHSYFADALESPPVMKLSAPVTVVVAADDPITSAFPRRHRDWELLAEHVDVHELPTAATTSYAPVRPRRHGPCSAPPSCLPIPKLKGN